MVGTEPSRNMRRLDEKVALQSRQGTAW